MKDLKEKEINQKGSKGQVFLPVGTVKAEPEASSFLGAARWPVCLEQS